MTNKLKLYSHPEPAQIRKHENEQQIDNVSAMVDFESMTVAQLKDELKARGLKVGGKKSELIERLAAR
ncbi:MAG UNVERIFIED_CONTAM: SAP domain-containing protein [Microcystis novacekii LVE1205-3]